jgi:arginine deiminase
MSTNNSIYVESEIGTLKKVLIHSPDAGIGKIIPSKFRDWLYDDTVHLETMRHEYDQYLKLLLYFIDPEIANKVDRDLDKNRDILKPDNPLYFASDKVIDVQYILSLILDGNNTTIRQRLISAICAVEGCPFSVEEELLKLEGRELAKTLITGVIEKNISPDTDNSNVNFIFPPLPNLIFTRDIAITIKDHILLSKTAKQVRKRESIIMKYILYYHILKDSEDRIIEISEESDFFLEDEEIQKDKIITIEGGDIMMIGANHLIVGCSERTSHSAVNSIIHTIFSKSDLLGIEYISVITIPQDRAQMHIDTIFTQISKSAWIIHTNFSEELKRKQDEKKLDRTSLFYTKGSSSLNSVTVTQFYKNMQESYRPNSSYIYVSNKTTGIESLLEQISERDFQVKESDVKIIYSGNNEFPYDEREQWTDSCNLLCIKDSVVIGYDRNTKTAEAFQKKLQYNVIKSKELLEKFKSGVIKPEEVQNTLILLESSELSRARGGSHCMSMPLLRDKII